MADTLKLEIVTPEGWGYTDDVEMVTVPSPHGEMGILPMHVPLVTEVCAGEVIVRKDGRESFYAVGNGFIRITADRVAIFTDMAIHAENIDEAAAEEARRRAEARLAEDLDDEENAMVSATLAHSLAQLHVKHRHHRPA